MILPFVLIALCGAVSGDVSEIINPSREYLPPTRGYLPPVLPKLRVPSTFTPAITTTSYQQNPQPFSTPLLNLAQEIQPQSTAEIIRPVAPTFENKEIITAPSVTNAVSIRREYLPPLTTTTVGNQRNDNLPVVPFIATPNGITIHSNGNDDDLEVLTNTISQPSLNAVTVPQPTAGVVTGTTDLTSTRITSHPSVVTFVSGTSPVPITAETTSVPAYIQNTAAALTTEDSSETDPFIRINASELSESIDGLPSEVVEVTTPETILSEDGYHYSVPLVSFGG